MRFNAAIGQHGEPDRIPFHGALVRMDVLGCLFIQRRQGLGHEADPVPFDFAAARAQVLGDYRNEAVDKLKLSGESFLRKRANVLIADDLR